MSKVSRAVQNLNAQRIKFGKIEEDINDLFFQI